MSPTGAVVSQDFESGIATGWNLVGSDPKKSVGWRVCKKRSKSPGSYSLCYCDVANYDYDSPGTPNNGTATMPMIKLNPKNAALTFWLYFDVERLSSFDVFSVEIDDGMTTIEVWESKPRKMRSWEEVKIDLSAYSGKNISIRFSFDTVDQNSNSGEGVYIDDVLLYHGC